MPINIRWFERLMYLAVVIGVASDWLAYPEDPRDLHPEFGPAAAGIAYFGALFVVYGITILLIYLTARRRKNWARWVLISMFIMLFSYNLVAYLNDSDQLTFTLADVLLWVGAAIEAVAYVIVFTGDARPWFRSTEATL